MSTRVLARLRAWLAGSGLAEGARLPPERDLSVNLGVSRAELRKALLVLEVEGWLERKVGRGTFLTKPRDQRRGAGLDSNINDLAERTGPHEAMMARLAIEPELARMAALHATPRQLSELRRLADAMRQATSWTGYEELDASFHDLIAEAGGNSLLHAVHKIVNGVRMVVVWRRLSTPDAAPAPDYHSFTEHDAIIEALENREGLMAQKAMRGHLQATLASMTAGS